MGSVGSVGWVGCVCGGAVVALGAADGWLTLAAGAPAPTVWEIDPSRVPGAQGYSVLHPDKDTRRDYRSIYDASGKADLLNTLIGHIVFFS